MSIYNGKSLGTREAAEAYNQRIWGWHKVPGNHACVNSVACTKCFHTIDDPVCFCLAVNTVGVTCPNCGNVEHNPLVPSLTGQNTSIPKFTLEPPPPSPAELTLYFYGKSGTQFARQNKQTLEIEYWWTDRSGSWGAYPGKNEPFVCKPRLKE